MNRFLALLLPTIALVKLNTPLSTGFKAWIALWASRPLNASNGLSDSSYLSLYFPISSSLLPSTPVNSPPEPPPEEYAPPEGPALANEESRYDPMYLTFSYSLRLSV